MACKKAKEALTENVVRRFQGASKRANNDQVKSGEGAAARGSVREVLLQLSRLVDAFFGQAGVPQWVLWRQFVA